MSLTQVCAEMRKQGIPCNNRSVGDRIESGEYTFGRLVNVGPNGNRHFEIWRRDFYEWLDKMCGTGRAAQRNEPKAPAAPATLDAHADQIIKWASICSNPMHRESDCEYCPYRVKGLCMDAMLADAASALLAYTNSIVCA